LVIDGKPHVKNLHTILTEWLEFSRSNFTSPFAISSRSGAHTSTYIRRIIDCLLNIDAVIAIIRYEDEPKATLIIRFKLSEKQAEAILELKLRHLAKLEEIKIKAEQEQLDMERKQLENYLASSALLRTLMRNELLADAQNMVTHGVHPL